MLARCADHGAFEGTACPSCGAAGKPLADEPQRVRLSKFLSGALRHFPDDVGIEVDAEGWTALPSLIEVAAERYPFADRETVLAVLEVDEKGRFERDGDRVRAAYGHSIDVDLGPAGTRTEPKRLYHATAASKLAAIRSEGLRPMDRQEVHLTPEPEQAMMVGHRHATDPVLLVVDAEQMREHGHELHRRAETVITCEHVPPAYIEVVGEEG